MANMVNKSKVGLSEIVEKMNLESLTPDIGIENIYLEVPEVNRPALQLTGFFDRFDNDRIQVIGDVEYYYMKELTKEERIKRYTQVFLCGIPCLIFCRGNMPQPEVVKLAQEYAVPIFKSNSSTSSFMAEVIRWLNVKLAPCEVIHGVMVDVYGEGVLILGESGIGKSEAALELIQRGHRLVTDDVVEVRKVSDVTLIGTSPDITKHLMELRGIGVINVKMLFGIQSVIESQRIDLVVKLEEWDPHKKYDRLGMEEDYVEYMGNRVVCNTIPIRPGRNLAVIVEAAAINHRQKLMGYNAAQELYERIRKNKEKNG